jgi:hypothetical protein
MQNQRVDPVYEVDFILITYSGPALNLFRMQLAHALDSPEYLTKGGRAGSIEKTVQRIQRMLRGHPEAALKREEIRRLLGMT